MRQSLIQLCETYESNRKAIAKSYLFEDMRIVAASAGVFALNRRSITTEEVKRAKATVKAGTPILSAFRGETAIPLHCLIAASPCPDELLQKSQELYKFLKKQFFGRTYLPLASVFMAQSAPEYQFEELAARTKQIYKQLKASHPFLTGEEDEVICSLLAMDSRSVEQIGADCEFCYQMLKGQFGVFADKDGIQSLSYIIALAGGNMEYNCQRAIDLFHLLKEEGSAFGKGRELCGLGALAILPNPLEELASELIEVSNTLKQQSGYGILQIDRRHRMLHASMLLSCDLASDATGVAAVIQSTIASVIAEEIMMIILISSSTSAQSSHS